MKKWMTKAGNRMVLTLFDGQDEREVRVPFKFEICPECNGSASTSRHIECDGGGFTASEFAEACDGDEDFADDYFAGRYDRPCDECRGTPGRVMVPDLDTLSADDRKLWEEQCADEIAYQAESAAERRMGA